MAETTVRELRNHGGEVIDRVLAGERLIITRDGTAVAELRPLPRRAVNAHVVVERFRGLAPIDATRFRADVDAVIDQTW